MKKTALSLSMLMLAVFLMVAPAYADTLNLSLAKPHTNGHTERNPHLQRYCLRPIRE
jgi:Spy/CpxP family protein refolding chaperone